MRIAVRCGARGTAGPPECWPIWSGRTCCWCRWTGGGEWYRYHHLFRDMLLAELHRLEPGLLPVLYRRAAQWHERNGRARRGNGVLDEGGRGGFRGSPSRHAGVSRLPAGPGRDRSSGGSGGWKIMRPGKTPGRRRPGGDDLRLDREAGRGRTMGRRSPSGEPPPASLPDGSTSIEPWLALLRALLCRGGVEQMRADAELAARTMAAAVSGGPRRSCTWGWRI